MNHDHDLANAIAGFVIEAAREDIANWGMDGFGCSDEIVEGVRRILAGDAAAAVLKQKQLRVQYELLHEYYLSKYQSLTNTGIRLDGSPWPECSTWQPPSPEGVQELNEIGRELDALKAELEGTP
jgi:hypothetical protein